MDGQIVVDSRSLLSNRSPSLLSPSPARRASFWKSGKVRGLETGFVMFTNGLPCAVTSSVSPGLRLSTVRPQERRTWRAVFFMSDKLPAVFVHVKDLRCVDFGCGFKYAVHLDGFGQPPQIFLARNFDRAELLCDGRRQLNVEQDDAVAAQVLNQMVKRGLRRVADPVEHGFAREESSDGHAVDAADELRSLPTFNAVLMPFFVQPRIGFNEVGADPGALASGSRLRARLDDFAEGAVNRDFKDAIANHSRQTFRNMEPVQLKNRARVG